MLAISRNVNYYRISTQFAITKLFCEQNFWPMDAFDIVRKLVDTMIFLFGYPDTIISGCTYGISLFFMIILEYDWLGYQL